MNPLRIIAGVLALGAGAALGMWLMTLSQFGNYHFKERPFVQGGTNSKQNSDSGAPKEVPPVTIPAGPKMNLALLVAKLDQLTRKPAAVTLSDPKKKELLEQLKGLDELDQLSEADAKKRFDEVLKTVEENKDSLEAAGYRWPGSPAQPSVDDYGKHLKALREQLAKGKSA